MRRLQQILDELVEAGAAGALMHYRDQQGYWRGSSGVADLSANRPVDPDGWFRIGSVTKTFTSVVVLSLVRDGLVTLNDTCEQWLPGLVPGGNGITVRQLLDHTSGIYNYTADFTDPKQIVFDRHKHWEPKRAIDIAAAHAPLFEPGVSWAYSNTNYILLGLIIEAAAASTYAAELQAKVFAPLALERTLAPGDEETLPEPHAHGYLHVDGELVDITDFNASQAWAAGELVATADDLNRFYAGLLTGELLRPSELGYMLSVPDNGHYGLGINRVELPSGLILWGHFGAISGYFAGSFHSTDVSRQATFSYTSTATEPDTSDLLVNIFTDDH